MASLKKIIIVDDDERNIFALDAVLKAKGYQCISSTNAEDGLNILQTQNDIGIALIDMMMPGLDGYQMIKIIRENAALKDFPVVAVTAQAMVGDREKCLRSGADDYISKPIDVDALLKIIQQYLN